MSIIVIEKIKRPVKVFFFTSLFNEDFMSNVVRVQLAKKVGTERSEASFASTLLVKDFKDTLKGSSVVFDGFPRDTIPTLND